MKSISIRKSAAKLLRINTSLALTLTLLATSVVVLQPVFAEPASAVDRIQKQTGFNARAWSVTSPDAQGIRYVGGDFTSYQAWNTGQGAAVDATTGEVDPSFPSVSGWPYEKAVTPDGNGGWYIGGAMDTVGDYNVSRTAHLNADGSLDSTWLPVVTGGQGVLSIAKYGDVIILGGSFTAVNGVARNRLAAVKTDGTLLPWNPAASQAVHTVSISGDTAYVGGQFSSLAGIPRSLVGSIRLGDRTGVPGETCLTSWDAADCITAWDPSASGWGVKSVVVDTDYTYIIGAISQVGGANRTGAAKVSTATGVVQAWDPGFDSEAGAGTIMGGKIYIGGGFGVAGGETRRLVAAWDVTTDVLEAWNPDVTGNQVTTMASAAGKVYFGGMFAYVGTSGRNHAAAVDAAGELTAWDPHVCNQNNGANSTVFGISATATQVYLMGDFNCMGGQKRMHAAAVSDSGLLTSWAPVVNGPVYSFSKTGSTIYLGGNFSNVNGVSRSGAAAVDTSGVVTGWNPSPDGRAVSIIATPTKIYMAGWFSNVGGTPRNNLAVLDPTTGALDLTFDAQLDGAVRTMTLDGNTLFIGGDFGNVGGEAHQSVASINAATGAVNSAFTASTGVGNAIWSFLEAIAVVGDKVYIGGYFGQVNGVNKNYLAALDKTTGTTDTSFNPTVSSWVFAITPSTDGSVIYVGGQDLSVTTGADTAFGAAAIDVATGLLTSWRGNTGEVRGISVSDAVVYLAGNFSTVGGLTRENTAAVSTTGNVLEPWPMNAADAKTLEVTIPDTALGAVTSDPGGINCGGSCAYSYSAGSEVVLTAVPDTGYEFEAWTGECTGSSTTCTVTLAESASTVATFRIATVGGNTTPPQTVPGTTPTVTPTPTPSASAPAASVSTVKQTVQFAPGKTALDAADKRALDSVVLKAKALKAAKISIFGSAQKTSFSKLDKSLATARAEAVIAYLRSKGVKATFVVLPAKPASDRTAKGRSVVITVTGTK